MIKLDDIYGFPVIQNEKDGTVEIKSDCDYPQQSEECESLYHGIERQFIEIEKLKYPLNIKEWKVIIEPTEENIKEAFHNLSNQHKKLYQTFFQKDVP